MATLGNVLAAIQPVLGPVVQTTNATQTVAARFVTKADTAYFFDVKVVAVKTTDHAAAATYWRQACALNNAGTLSLVGSVRTVVTDNETTAGWDVDISTATADVDGDGTNDKTVTVLVTGAADTTINWRVIADVNKVS